MKEKLLFLNRNLATYSIDVEDQEKYRTAAANLGLHLSFGTSIGDGPSVKDGLLLMFVELASTSDQEKLIRKVRELEL